VKILRELPGPILSPFGPWLAVQAGHEPSLHHLSMTENSHRGSEFPAARGRIRRAVAAAHWPSVVGGNRPIGFGVGRRYELARRLMASDRVFRPRSGFNVHPETIRTPRPEPPAAGAAPAAE
jgi:hypothetical protein